MPYREYLDLPEACREWLEKQNKAFMHPVATYFNLDDMAWMKKEQGLEDATPGWYCRLSAPGYLDCTDWSGPYESEADALLNLYNTYGD